MKTNEELNAIREEIAGLTTKLKELSDKELETVIGGYVRGMAMDPRFYSAAKDYMGIFHETLAIEDKKAFAEMYDQAIGPNVSTALAKESIAEQVETIVDVYGKN